MQGVRHAPFNGQFCLLEQLHPYPALTVVGLSTLLLWFLITVAMFVPIENPGITVSTWEMAINHAKELLPDICPDMAAVWRIKPYRLPISLPSFPDAGGLKLQVGIEASVLQSRLIHVFGLIENFFIT